MKNLLTLEYGAEAITTATQFVSATGPEPIDVVGAKQHCRIDVDDEAALIERWILAARRKVEQDTGRALTRQTWDLFLDAFPGCRQPIELPYPPLASVVGVYSSDSSNVETTLSAANYIVDTAFEPGRIGLADGGSWPWDLRTFRPGRVRFTCGYAEGTAPEELVRAIALVIGWLSKNREPETWEQAAYDALIGPYVLWPIG